MSLIQNIVLSWMDLTLYTVLSYKLLSMKINKRTTLPIILFGIATGTLSFYFDNGFISALLGLFVFSYLLLQFRKNLLQTIYIYIIDTIILIALQVGMVVVLSFVLDTIENNFLVGISSQIFSLFFVTIIYLKVPIDTFMNYILSKNKIFFYLILNLFVLSFVILIYWHINISGFIENIIVMSISAILIIVLNFVLLNNGLKNKFQEEELRIYKVYTPIIEELMNEIRARQHEFDNHIQALYMVSIAKNGENNEIVEYLEQFYETNKLNDLIKLHNKLIAGLLYSKKKKALESKIDFDVELRTYQITSAMKEFEVVEILGILLDNALETKVENNKTYLKLDKEKDMNVVQVMNKHPYLSKEKIEEMFKKGISSKGEGRGYGLYRLQSICKKYQAQITIENTSIDHENHVSIKIIF